MINDKFRIKLKSIENGEDLTILGFLLDKSNGLLNFPVEGDKWEIISCDQTTGFLDENDKEIFFGDSVIFNNSYENIYEVTVNELTQVAMVSGEVGQLELHKCYKVIEVIEDEHL